ncbi:hypothetical protein OUZ56_004957 [Daphnia magna]|uniref:Uncharacterized protein n=1 Tax=Daphnia magna TaxID=35525 RepID=A0ABQ9YRQ3_9CRUS|nr:hypothetical protein OUZ56_004957 [Daphnia magna]
MDNKKRMMDFGPSPTRRYCDEIRTMMVKKYSVHQYTTAAKQLGVGASKKKKKLTANSTGEVEAQRRAGSSRTVDGKAIPVALA